MRQHSLWLRLAAVLVALACSGSWAAAMEFSPLRIDNATVFIAATGPIRPGDGERLTSVFLTLPRDGLNVLVLDSPGGSVVAGEALAAVIRRLKLRVAVVNDSICASACFLLFAASPQRFYTPGARIGVHSAVRGEFETLDSMAVTTFMARSAAEMGVPEGIVGRMVMTPPGSMAWLSDADLAAMGAQKLTGPSNTTSSAAPPSPPLPVAQPPAVVASRTDQGTSPSTASKPGTVPKDEQSPTFQLGRSDRVAWEQWYATLTGDTLLGATYWSSERSKRRPGNCVGTPEFTKGCLEARQRLSVSDVKRKTDPQYWWGWNSL